MKLVKIPLKIPANLNKPLELPPFALSAQEKADIKSSPFFTSIMSAPVRVIEPLPPYMKDLIRFVPLGANGKLSLTKLKKEGTTFEVFKMYDKSIAQQLIENPNTTKIRTPTSMFPRLSVTQLLTKSWCELQEFYKAHSGGGDKVKTARMISGSKIHADLEDSLHPPVDYTQADGIENIRPARGIGIEAEFRWLFENLTRLRTLFMEGEARELYVFGFLNVHNGEFLDFSKGKDPDIQDYLPITGIIDYLKLNKSRPFYEEEDMDFIVSEVEKEDLSTSKLSVIDVKTRARPIVPAHKSVVENSKLQIMYYAKFMKQFHSLEETIRIFESYFAFKDIDIDTPLPIDSILIILDKFPEVFENDFRLIQNGEIIHEYVKSVPFTNPYITEHDFKSPLLKSFSDTWAQPITIRYFILRNAQLLSKLSKLADEEDLRIQYYCKDSMFNETRFNYDEGRILQNNKSSMDFWFSRREPVPIEPTFWNGNSKCKYCDFSDYCSVYDKIKKLG